MSCNCGPWEKTGKNSRRRRCGKGSMEVFFDPRWIYGTRVPGFRSVVDADGRTFDLGHSPTLSAAKKKAARKYRAVTGC